MQKIVSIAVAALALILVGGSSGARADNTRGVCNSIIADGLGAAQQVVNGVGDPVQQCTEVGEALSEFLTTPGCFEAFAAGELRGLGGPADNYVNGPNAGALKPVGEAICGALCGCGFFPALPPEICPTFACP
jgi:hypothetical protein